MATGWVRAWKHRKKTRSAAKQKKLLKTHNHRLNRIAGKNMDKDVVRLSGWDVI